MPYDENREGEHEGFLTGDRLLLTLGLAGTALFVSSAVAYAEEGSSPSITIPDSATATLIVSSQSTIDSSTTLISDLSSALDQVSQLALAVSDSSIVTTQVIDSATVAIAQAQTSLATLESTTALAETATTLAQVESLTVTQIQNLIDTQTATVSSHQTAYDSATALANASNSSTVYTETFTNNTINTPMLITSDGSTVTATPVNNASIGGNWNTANNVVSGPGLILMGPTQDVTIDFTPTGNVTSVTFGVYAKNGDANAIAMTTTGNTVTEVINDNVNPNYPGYVSQETITVTSGESIDTLTIIKDADYYVIDNISFTVTSSNAVLAQQASDAQANLNSSQQTLSLLQAADSSVTTMITAQADTDNDVDDAQQKVADAQVMVSQSALDILQNNVTSLQQTASNLTPTSYVSLALSNAQTAIDDAQTAVDAAVAKKTQADTYQLAAGLTTTVDSATATVLVKTDELADAQQAVDAQQDVVDDAQDVVDAAQAVVDSQTQQGLKVEVYNVLGQNNAPTLPTGASPIYTAVDTDGIDEQWGGGAVAGSNNSEDVIVIYSGTWTPTYTGTQYVHAPADDGVKLYLDGVLVIDDWFDKGGGGSTADVSTQSGVSIDFEMWYYENGGGAWVQLLRYTDNGTWEVIPGSEFTTTSASEQEITALTTAQSTLQTETEELETLEDEESTKETELASAQATLSLAQSAETSRGEYVALAQTAIDKTITALETTDVAKVVVQAEVTRQATPPTPPPPPPAPSVDPTPQPQPEQPNPQPPTENDEVSPNDPLPETPTDTEDPLEPEPETEEPTEPESPSDDSTPDDEDDTSDDSDSEEPQPPSEEEELEDDQEEQDPTPEDPQPEPEEPEEDPEQEEPSQESEPQENEEDEPLDDNTPQPDEVKNLAEDLAADGKLTSEEKQVIASALVAAFVESSGAVPASALAEAGIEAKDLPPETPLELANGVVIEAQVQAAFEVLADPGELLGAIFDDPAQVLMALTNLGADMSPEEREESQKVVVASVVVTGVAVQAAASAAAAAAAASSSSSSSGGGAPVGRENGTRRPARKSSKIRKSTHRRKIK